MSPPSNFEQLCQSRDDWLRRFEAHLRESIRAAEQRHEHYRHHGAFTELRDTWAIESHVISIVALLGANRAPDRNPSAPQLPQPNNLPPTCPETTEAKAPPRHRARRHRVKPTAAPVVSVGNGGPPTSNQ